LRNSNIILSAFTASEIHHRQGPGCNKDINKQSVGNLVPKVTASKDTPGDQLLEIKLTTTVV